jgi:glyceraldehyde-3-phosphate dehydrogenase/erythrose-4-phosphate dehydrogenase
MTGNRVHVIGTGTIGEPLIGILADMRRTLGIDEVTFSKKTPLLTDRSKVFSLVKRGANFAAEHDKWPEFQKLGMEPIYDFEEAIARADVVIDCTPNGSGLSNKRQFYERYSRSVRGFLAQGSEFGFGKPYAYGVNDEALNEKDQFIQVVSCNTHNIGVMVKTLAFNHESMLIRDGRFLCIRRANDISDSDGMAPAPKVSKHEEPWGTHHARDAFHLFKTLGLEPNLFSSAVKVNSQYMHCIWFDMLMDEPITLEEAEERIAENPRVATTYKDMSSLVFSFGRDHGRFGRILNQAVVVLPSLHVRNGNEVLGFCFTPQDGNSLLTSIAATVRFLHPESHDNIMHSLDSMLFKEI